MLLTFLPSLHVKAPLFATFFPLKTLYYLCFSAPCKVFWEVDWRAAPAASPSRPLEAAPVAPFPERPRPLPGPGTPSLPTPLSSRLLRLVLMPLSPPLPVSPPPHPSQELVTWTNLVPLDVLFFPIPDGLSGPWASFSVVITVNTWARRFQTVRDKATEK